VSLRQRAKFQAQLMQFSILSQRIAFVIWVFGKFVFLCSPASSSQELPCRDDSYLLELKTAAKKKRLWEDRQWHVLMHYRPRLFGSGVKSQVDDESFFLSPRGKYDPQAELEATLSNFFASTVEGDGSMHPQCRFVARYHWLKQELGFDPKRLPERSCPGFNDLVAGLDPETVTLVFPVAFLNNPASMFGHTLIRVDSKKMNEQTRLLDFTFSYSARTQQERGLSFALKGLCGGYQGHFFIAPYYVQVKNYGDVENRDIWEYRLTLTQEEVRRMLMHAWELKSVYFDYYFLDENCSYELLSLLEAARPSLHLLDQFRLWAVPVDTIRAVTDVEDLAQSVTFRPSGRTVLQEWTYCLKPKWQKIAKYIGDNKCPVDVVSQEAFSPFDQAKILELAIQYVGYQNAEENKEPPENDSRLMPILEARSRLNVPPQTPRIEQPAVRPDQGHRTSRVGVYYGYENDRHFFELDFRPVLHDLMDPPGGYIHGAQLEFLNMAVKYWERKNRLTLERLDFVNIMSVPTRNLFIKPFSWKANAGLKRRLFTGNDRPLTGHFNFGAGVSYDLPAAAVTYFFAEGMAVISDRFDEKLALGAGPSCGTIFEMTEKWRMGFCARTLAFTLGSTRRNYDISLENSIDLTPNGSFRFCLSRNKEFGRYYYSFTTGYHIYF
jgi:hypothetical protein